ncbi:SH3 domain-containing protein [Ramlibacter albus]|uniref:SH3 domain-containing protein n=1 Tax=Ramlibacter albus TaxID=2079448 RepID=A0A923S2A9_9BURK|nr:SH3 domain-containing protein [Ramlibacter albus]MBC5765289.1 SH3 domain-containing protein [Ramlibacter albus]
MTGKRMPRRLGALAATLLLACGLAAAQSPGEPALIKRATELRDAPGESGRSLGALPAQSTVTRLEQRQGPWVQVRNAAGATGWVHLFDIAPTTGAQAPQGTQGPSAGGLMRGVTGMFARPQQQQMTTSTSTIGIRGLGAEDIAKAQPNTAAVAQMEAQRANEGQAREFASRAQLRSENVEPLPAPRRAPGTANPPGNPQ